MFLDVVDVDSVSCQEPQVEPLSCQSCRPQRTRRCFDRHSIGPIFSVAARGGADIPADTRANHAGRNALEDVSISIRSVRYFQWQREAAPTFQPTRRVWAEEHEPWTCRGRSSNVAHQWCNCAIACGNIKLPTRSLNVCNISHNPNSFFSFTFCSAQHCYG